MDSNHRRLSQQIYSLPHLTALVLAPALCPIIAQAPKRADRGIRTLDPEITNHVLWPTELYRQYVKPFWKRDCKDRHYL